MNDAPVRLDLESTEYRPNPVENIGQMKIFTDALGQSGKPFVVYFEDAPEVTRGKHRYVDDVTILYVAGSCVIEGEGEYKAGDVRVVPLGHVCQGATIGKDGCHYWAVSPSDPTALEVVDKVVAPAVIEGIPSIPHFAAPYDWEEIEKVVKTSGVVVLEKRLSEQVLDQLNSEFDSEIHAQEISRGTNSPSLVYNHFAGENTTRLHGLSAFSNAAAKLIADPEMVDFATHAMKGACHSVRLCTAMLLQVNSGQTAQYFHSDYKAWPHLDSEPVPINITAMYALSDFTAENGATVFAPNSWAWQKDRNPRRSEVVPAEMNKGDVALFRADLQHGAGANSTEEMSRRGLFISYCAGWLRPVENSFLNVPRERLKELPKEILPLLGYALHDASPEHAGIIGQYLGGDPMNAIKELI